VSGLGESKRRRARLVSAGRLASCDLGLEGRCGYRFDPATFAASAPETSQLLTLLPPTNLIIINA